MAGEVWRVAVAALAVLWLGLGAPAAAADDVGVCGYRAVLFGAQNYVHDSVSDLRTPNRDIAAIGSALEDRYGFQVETFPDATRQQILDRLEALRGDVRDCEAVVVYYAGHGDLDDALDEGFWLPVDARLDSKANWISNDDVASRLRALPARHVLLVADSCFAGKLFRGLEKMPPPAEGADLARARKMAALQSRMVLTSGGEELVADEYLDSGMSVFAYFLHQRLLTAEARFVTVDQWFSRLREGVMDNAEQQPQLGRLFGAGHEGGTLVLVNHEGSAEIVEEGAEVAPAVVARDSVTETTSTGIELVRVAGGSFLMGAAPDETAQRVDERPTRMMEVPTLWVSRSEITQAQWREVMGTQPSAVTDCAECPVEQVTWLEAVAFANALSEREGRKPVYRIKRGEVAWKPRRNGYRLLTEAEWEHAARGGEPYTFSGSQVAAEVAWVQSNAAGRPRPVCTRAPNAFDLCDMSGNVREWVWDRYDPDAYVRLDASEARGPEVGLLRVQRGGSFDRAEAEARVARRFQATPESRQAQVGFRIARED